jgi:hypothetical protein
MTRPIRYVQQHAIAFLALTCALLALGGSSYAAFTISGGQIRNHTIDPVKFNANLIAGNVRGWARVTPSGHVVAERGVYGSPVQIANNIYVVRWKSRVSKCAATVSVDSVLSAPTEPPNLRAGYASASISASSRRSPFGATSAVMTFNQQGQPTPLGFDVVVVC